MWLQVTAMGILVYSISGGSATAVGLLAALNALPFFLGGMLLAGLGDRFDRRKLLIAVQSVPMAGGGGPVSSDVSGCPAIVAFVCGGAGHGHQPDGGLSHAAGVCGGPDPPEAAPGGGGDVFPGIQHMQGGGPGFGRLYHCGMGGRPPLSVAMSWPVFR